MNTLKKIKVVPLVSVIITTHNRVDLLSRAIESVISQEYKNLEIIIVDDGSKDNTEQLIQNYRKKYNHIKYIKHQKALGANAARNSGILSANGEFITGLDDDDEFTPNRIQILIDNYSDDFSLITTRNVKVTKTDRKTTKYIPIIDIDTMLYFNAIGNQVLVKKEKIIKVGLFDEKLKRYQDYDMWLRLIKEYGNAKIVNKVTQIIHYEHDIASNNIKKNNFNGAFKFYKKHRCLMNKKQKTMQLYNIFRLQEKKITLKKAFIFLTLNTVKSLSKYFLLRK